MSFLKVNISGLEEVYERVERISRESEAVLIKALNTGAVDAKETAAKAMTGRVNLGVREGKNIDINRARAEMTILKANAGRYESRVVGTRKPFTFRKGGAYEATFWGNRQGVSEYQTGSQRYHEKWFMITLKNSGYRVAAKREIGLTGKSKVKVAYAPSVDQMLDDIIKYPKYHEFTINTVRDKIVAEMEKMNAK